ncbi:unnamed protein product [Amoebophrya sp. A120]|nr:unnamed protein product [Amoebophrya sp. A120]|eukprot:GSA120T00005687001.1
MTGASVLVFVDVLPAYVPWYEEEEAADNNWWQNDHDQAQAAIEGLTLGATLRYQRSEDYPEIARCTLRSAEDRDALIKRLERSGVQLLTHFCAFARVISSEAEEVKQLDALTERRDNAQKGIAVLEKSFGGNLEEAQAACTKVTEADFDKVEKGLEAFGEACSAAENFVGPGDENAGGAEVGTAVKFHRKLRTIFNEIREQHKRLSEKLKALRLKWSEAVTSLKPLVPAGDPREKAIERGPPARQCIEIDDGNISKDFHRAVYLQYPDKYGAGGAGFSKFQQQRDDRYVANALEANFGAVLWFERAAPQFEKPRDAVAVLSTAEAARAAAAAEPIALPSSENQGPGSAGVVRVELYTEVRRTLLGTVSETRSPAVDASPPPASATSASGSSNHGPQKQRREAQARSQQDTPAGASASRQVPQEQRPTLLQTAHADLTSEILRAVPAGTKSSSSSSENNQPYESVRNRSEKRRDGGTHKSHVHGKEESRERVQTASGSSTQKPSTREFNNMHLNENTIASNGFVNTGGSASSSFSTSKPSRCDESTTFHLHPPASEKVAKAKRKTIAGEKNEQPAAASSTKKNVTLPQQSVSGAREGDTKSKKRPEEEVNPEPTAKRRALDEPQHAKLGQKSSSSSASVSAVQILDVAPAQRESVGSKGGKEQVLTESEKRDIDEITALDLAQAKELCGQRKLGNVPSERSARLVWRLLSHSFPGAAKQLLVYGYLAEAQQAELSVIADLCPQFSRYPLKSAMYKEQTQMFRGKRKKVDTLTAIMEHLLDGV